MNKLIVIIGSLILCLFISNKQTKAGLCLSLFCDPYNYDDDLNGGSGSLLIDSINEPDKLGPLVDYWTRMDKNNKVQRDINIKFANWVEQLEDSNISNSINYWIGFLYKSLLDNKEYELKFNLNNNNNDEERELIKLLIRQVLEIPMTKRKGGCRFKNVHRSLALYDQLFGFKVGLLGINKQGEGKTSEGVIKYPKLKKYLDDYFEIRIENCLDSFNINYNEELKNNIFLFEPLKSQLDSILIKYLIISKNNDLSLFKSNNNVNNINERLIILAKTLNANKVIDIDNKINKLIETNQVLNGECNRLIQDSSSSLGILILALQFKPKMMVKKMRSYIDDYYSEDEEDDGDDEEREEHVNEWSNILKLLEYTRICQEMYSLSSSSSSQSESPSASESASTK